MKKKEVKKKVSEADKRKDGWLLGYDVRWMKSEPSHPDYEKVKKEAKKYKMWD